MPGTLEACHANYQRIAANCCLFSTACCPGPPWNLALARDPPQFTIAPAAIGSECTGATSPSLVSRIVRPFCGRHRDNASIVNGIHTLRYNWADVTQRPCHVAAEVAAVLRQRGWRGTPRPCGPSCSLNDWPQR